jgi:Clostridial hydrophobic W
LLEFLDRNLKTFSRPIRDTIGLIVATLLAIVILHGAVAPTYVHGHVYVVNAEEDARELAGAFWLVRGTESYVTNENGYFLLPVRGFIPQRERIQLKDSAGHYLDEFSFWAPWPVLSALRPAEFDVIFRAYKKGGSRIQLTERNTSGLMDALVAITLNAEAFGFQQVRAPSANLFILAHLENIGDIACRGGGWCGTRGENRRLEGFQLRLPQGIGQLSLMYMCHIENQGDSPRLVADQFCGTRGQGKRLEGFAVKLSGRDASRFSVAYQAHGQNYGDSPVARNGEYVGTRDRALRVEAIKVWLEPR